MSIVLAMLALSFLIFFHELGHFLAAKFFHVGVNEFSIGMGPRILSVLYKNTRYSIKLLPLGGSCAMLGEDAAGSGDFLAPKQEENTENVYDFDGVLYSEEELKTKSFEGKPAWQRFIICIAGVFNNFLLGFLIALFLIVNLGVQVPIISSSNVSTPAMESGLQEGDQIHFVKIGNAKGRIVHTYSELAMYLELHKEEIEGGEVSLTVLRNWEKLNFQFPAYKDPATGLYRMGVSLSSERLKIKNPLKIIEYSFYELAFNARVVIDSLALISKGKVSRQEVMGPVGTVAVIGESVSSSSQYGYFVMLIVLLNLSMMLSINLAVMNLLPIPALDGGRLLFILLEMLARKRLNPKWEERINTAGMVFLLALMVLILGNDVFNLLTGAYSTYLSS